MVTLYTLNVTGLLANGSLHKTTLQFTEFTDTQIADYNFNFSELYPNTKYNFTLVGCTVIGCGPSTEIFDVHTKEMGT